MADLTALTQKRGNLKATLTNIRKWVDKIDDGVFIEQMEARLEKIDKLWDDFNQVNDEVVMQNGASDADTFHDKFFETKALLSRAIRARNQPDGNATSNEPSLRLNSSIDQLVQQQRSFFDGFTDFSRSQTVDLRPPRITIEPFNGEYESWMTFRDLYLSSIHTNEKLSNVQKFKCLMSFLRGSAHNLLMNIPITDANYASAWEKLSERYNKPKILIHALIKRFMDQATVSKGGKSLRELAETSDEVIRGLRAIGKEAETRDVWLTYLLFEKLDNDTRMQWAAESDEEDYPTFTKFLRFLTKRCNILEACQMVNSPNQGLTKNNQFNARRQSSTSHTASLVISCPMCKSKHMLHRCYRFQALELKSRMDFVRTNHLCPNCLRTDHSVTDCPSSYKCIICAQPHHTILHNETSTHPSTSTNMAISNSSSSITDSSTSIADSSSSITNLVTQTSNALVSYTPKPASYSHLSNKINQNPRINFANQVQTLLPTALIHVKDDAGKLHIARALLDSGSQSTFLTESYAQRLRLNRTHSCISVSGLATSNAGKTKGAVQLQLISRHNAQNTISVTALILTRLTSNIPSRRIDITRWTYVNELELADHQFNNPGPIDILIGADIFLDILCTDRVTSQNYPIAQLTIFGWVLCGTFPDQRKFDEPELQISHRKCYYADIHATLEKFWHLEDIHTIPELSLEDKRCETIFADHHDRDPAGKYIVRLPFRKSIALGNSLDTAMKRLFSMERKFNRDESLKVAYSEFMAEYLQLGHMESVPESEINIPWRKKYYLPHHAIRKLSSTTTKLRVVFDGSAKSTSGESLNDNLLIGPKLQQNLVNILIRFRKNSIAISADMEKMFRQVWVHKSDRDFQRIIWRQNAADPIKHYRLTTVTYGTRSASYLAVRSIQQATTDHGAKFQIAAYVLNRDLYMDDLLSGSENIDEAIQIYNQTIALCKEAGFNLRKWMSNSTELLSVIPQENQETRPLEFDDESLGIKTLGLNWNPKEDSFQFKVKLDEYRTATKRTILSEAASIFDPLGWLSPTTIQVKILFQRLWLQKLGWDDHLPAEIEEDWRIIRNALPEIEKIRIPRYISISTKVCRIQLHAFCDASELAYASCVYVRVEKLSGEVTTSLIAAKTKVAPLKQISLPKLELCGAFLLCKLVRLVKESLGQTFDDIYAWTDSKIVLSWLSDHPRRWQTFIGNRTSQILEEIPRQGWNHVSSRENPADCASRGISSSKLLAHSLWWYGPHWLQLQQCSWPSASTHNLQLSESEVNYSLENRRKAIDNFHRQLNYNFLDELFIKISSYEKIKRIVSYIFRYYSNLKNAVKSEGVKLGSQSKPLEIVTLHEMKKSEELCIKWAQISAFEDEINAVQSGRQIKNRGMRTLAPILDECGLLRVGGRLQESGCPFDTKHPIILPKGHVLTYHYIAEYHKRYLHPGPTLLMSLLRQRFWIIGGRFMVRNYVGKCIICFRQKSTTSTQFMGNLPKSRVSSGRPFLSTGVDLAGPLYLKANNGRGRNKIVKGYIVLFICFSVKAVHIELVSDMTTEAYIAALRRFIARRGCPIEITSDNGSNLIGSRRHLEELYQLYQNQTHINTISLFLTQNKIKFKFNPASAPHFGGLWEANIKSIKRHLTRVTSTATLTFEEMSTLLVQIEAVLNSRPLCPLNEDATVFDPLTPGHFLIGEALTAIPEPDLSHLTESRLSRWQNIQQRVQGFWKTWSVEYLTSLQQRQKWLDVGKEPHIDQLVVIKEDNLPPAKWAMGRITQLHPGRDGLTRVVTIRTLKGEFRRPLVKICPLPID